MKRFLTALLLAASAHAGDTTAFFEEKVLPLLRERCYECHSHESKIKGGLALDSKSGWQTGGDHGAAIAPGNVSKSLLVEAVRYTNPDMEMPPKGKLTANEIEVLEKWVAMGAPDPRSGSVVKTSGINIGAGKQFWAFQPVRDSQPPAVKNTNWPVNDVDRFILATQESAGLTPAPDADAHTWLRRVYFDLTGLPPTPEAVTSFLSELASGDSQTREQSDKEKGHEAGISWSPLPTVSLSSPQAQASCEQVIDHLLASPAFGERWARHWLDLTGYADQIGTSNNVFAEHAWRYRDYVIRATDIAKLVSQAELNPGARLEALWLRVLNRPITSTERDEANTLLDSLPADKAWIELTHALLASNEFLLRL